MKFTLSLALLLLTVGTRVSAAAMEYEIKHINPETSQVILSFNNEPDERLSKESLVITVDHPEISISKPQANHELQQWPGKKINEAERGWQGPVKLTINVSHTTTNINNAHLNISFTTNKQPQPSEHIIPLSFMNITEHAPATLQEASSPDEIGSKKDVSQTVMSASAPTQKSNWPTISSYVKGLVKSTESPWIRLLLVFLLGILMSLTPCIYPMIPITIGILQSQAGDSAGGNALRAFLYTVGMGVTYALFGLIASCTGPVCGYIFSQPIFVVALAALLMYFGLCMFGFIEMYIPRFLQVQRSGQRGGSLFAAFLFGLVSGTLASPCVSPGLALILSIVATLGNKLLGFALLFVFGVGLSMPLLIVGLSAGSLHLLPRAGMWMVEVKKLFGFLLFGLSFYYLSAIMPYEYLCYIIALFLISMGIYYIHSSYYTMIPSWKKINALLGMVLIASAVATTALAIQERFLQKHEDDHINIWLSDYQQARELAIRENKLLFIDVWADFCSICITINKTLLKDARVEAVLQNQFVPLKVNGTVPSSEPYATINAQFKITGFPAYLIVDPETLQVIKQWDSKIYKMDPQLFVEKLQKRIS